MFFLRKRPREVTLEDRFGGLRNAGFTVAPAGEGRLRIVRQSCGALVSLDPLEVKHAGILMGDEIGFLIDGGFQKFLETPSGRREPALASQLKALHEFEEDLREILGLPSLYNQSIGTVCDRHTYDRLVSRK